MSSPLSYANPIPLEKEKHKAFKLKKQDSYAFAANTNSLPLGGFEYFEASRHYPIFFVRTPQDTFISIALLSLRKSGHDLGEKWAGAYVPAYLRRYPFILSADGLVMFDADAPHVQEAEGDSLFNDDGEPTETAQEVINFLQGIEKGYRSTDAFCKALTEKKLLEEFNQTIKVDGATINLPAFYVINEKKLLETLSESEIAEWFRKGWLAWSYAHLHSLGSIAEIVKRARAVAESQGEQTEAS